MDLRGSGGGEACTGANKPSALVVGAGPTGLACAWYLRRSGKYGAIDIYDKDDHVGGCWAARGPHAVRHAPQIVDRTTYGALWALADEMDLGAELEAQLEDHAPPFWEAIRGLSLRVALELCFWWIAWLIGFIQGNEYLARYCSRTVTRDPWVRHMCLLLDGVPGPERMTVEALFASATSLGRARLAVFRQPNTFFEAWLLATSANFVPHMRLAGIGSGWLDFVHNDGEGHVQNLVFPDTDIFLCLDPGAYATLLIRCGESKTPMMEDGFTALERLCYRGVGFALEWSHREALTPELIAWVTRNAGNPYERYNDTVFGMRMMWVPSLREGCTVLRIDGCVISSATESGDPSHYANWRGIASALAQGRFATQLRAHPPNIIAWDPMIATNDSNGVRNCLSAMPARLNVADSVIHDASVNLIRDALPPHMRVRILGPAFDMRVLRHDAPELPYHTMQSALQSVARFFQ
jgi:hypothetical protein